MRRSISPSCLYDKYLCQGCGFKWPWSSTLPWIRPCSVPPQDVTTDPESSCEAMNLGTWQMSLRSISVPKLVILTFSLNSKPWEEKCGLFSILFPHDPAIWQRKEKHLATFAIAPLVPTLETRTENLFKAMSPSASCLCVLFFFLFAMTFLPKVKNAKSPLRPCLVFKLYKGWGWEKYMCAYVLMCARACV